MKVYSLKYKDKDGIEKEARITEMDSAEALKNDFEELEGMFNPKYVRIRRLKAQPGEAMHIEITLMAPSHYLDSKDDKTPKPCNSMTVHIVCYPGYPLKAVSAYYEKNHYLASPNVFRSGNACIDKWVLFKSSMITVAEKLLRDMIHYADVNKYDDAANSDMKKWHMDEAAAGRFPTIPPKLLFAPEPPAMPPRRTAAVKRTMDRTVPPLPRRDH